MAPASWPSVRQISRFASGSEASSRTLCLAACESGLQAVVEVAVAGGPRPLLREPSSAFLTREGTEDFQSQVNLEQAFSTRPLNSLASRPRPGSLPPAS